MAPNHTRHRTPLDTGARAEPKVWVQDGIAGEENPRPAEDDDYGRVDFDVDGFTATTVWVEVDKATGTYVLHYNGHDDLRIVDDGATGA